MFGVLARIESSMMSAETERNRRLRRRQMAEARKTKAGSSPLAFHWKLVVCLLLAVATFALYGRAIGYPFIERYDDEIYVTSNPHVQAGLAWQTVTWALRSTEYSNWHPVTWLSHALDCELWGLNAAGHHFTNVFLHAVNVVLLFLLLARATGAAGRSLMVAALFAVHPFNVESVAWIAERKNVLSMLFFLLTLGAYGWYALKPAVKRYVVVALLFALGLAAKPMVITLPCVLLLLDYWPLRRIERRSQPGDPSQVDDLEGLANDSSPGTSAVPRSPLWWLVLEKLPLLALSAANGAVTIFAQRSYGAMHLALSPGVRLENAVYAYAMYVWKAFWPAQLTVFYPHPGARLAIWQTGMATLFVMAVSALVWRERASRPCLVTGWLWYLGTLVPVIGLIQVGEQAMADRYAYLPLIGIFVMAVWGAADAAEHRRLSLRTRVTTAAVVLTVFMAFTWKQITYWRSSYDLWSHAVQVTKDNFTAETNLGFALMASDRSVEAVDHLQNAVRIRPSYALSHLSLAGALQLSGRPREAILEYETALGLGPAQSMLVAAYENLGRSYEQVGNYKDARACYEQALRINPEQQSTKEALDHLNLSEALRNVAESPSGRAFLRLGQILQKSGRVSQARTAYERALDLDPKLRDARKGLEGLGPQ